MPAPTRTLGRPIEYDLEEEGNALLAWAKKETSTLLLDFCNEREYPPQNLSEWAKLDKGFSEALKRTKSILGSRHHSRVNVNEYNYGVFQRYIGMYDPLLNEFENNEKEKDSKRRKDSNPEGLVNVYTRDFSKSKKDKNKPKD